MDDKKAYHDIITSIWKLLKVNLDVIKDIKDSNDPRWETIVNDFTHIESAAPPHLKKYAGDMVALHVWELERRWRK
jgi:hypothetical protein